jgi:hypothetical protein
MTLPLRRRPLLAAGLLAALVPARGSTTLPWTGPGPEPLLGFNADWARAHEGRPQGVPASYDWAHRGRIAAGNRPPAGFSALTGWGQVFWPDDAPAGAGGSVEIRRHQTLACTEPDGHWWRLQRGPIAGAAFRPDFAQNVARPPDEFQSDGDSARVRFARGTAFHFWPRSGRARLPSEPLRGLLVLLEARALPGDTTGAAPGWLLGLGADYWLDRQAAWDHFRTNKDVAVGRLRRVGPDWTWYGLSTAPDADLRRLVDKGFAESPAG